MRIHMPLDNHSYDILLDHKAILQLPSEIKKWYKGDKIFIVTDENVHRLHQNLVEDVLKDFSLVFVVVEPGETSKSFEVYESVIDQLIQQGMKRTDLLIAFGGGVIGDLAGFVASTLYRGVPYVQIPTTLLAQVDSSIGGKTAINSSKGKNMVGTFYQPKLVIIDPDFLKTLSDFEYKNGMAEVIKSAYIGDVVLQDKLLKGQIKTLEMIERSIMVKRQVVLIDEFDLNERMFLNFGHTFGHALEKQSKYEIAHGFAVAEGMLMATHIGERLGITPITVFKGLKILLEKYDLGLLNTNPIPLIEDVFYDKKNTHGQLKMVFLSEIGKPIIQPMTKEVLYECYHSQTSK
jgi:3-dehydroquinate synthase